MDKCILLSMLSTVSNSDKHPVASDSPDEIQPQLPAAATNSTGTFDWLFLPSHFMLPGSHPTPLESLPKTPSAHRFLAQTLLFRSVLVWAAITKIPQTWWRWGGGLVNNKHLSLIVLEAEKSKIKALADCLVRASFLVHRRLSSHCNLT